MLTRSKHGIWCDYCKYRWGTKNPKGQTQAVWTIKSVMAGKESVRHYCQPCANEVQTWADGSTWTFKEQIDYRLGRKTLDV